MNTKETAKLLGISMRRVQAMLKQDQNPSRRKTNFPGAKKKLIKHIIMREDWNIPPQDIENILKERVTSSPGWVE
jgi:hypothetical protein